MVVPPHFLKSLFGRAETAGPAIQSQANGGFCEAAQTSIARPELPWYLYTKGGQLSPYERQKATALSLYILDNYPAASYLVGLIARYSTPVQPQADSSDDDQNVLLQSLFFSWANRCDYSRRYSLWQMQAIGSHLIDTGGEVGYWLRKTDEGLKLCIVEAWQIITPEDHYDDDECFEGVQTKDGVVTGYWVLEGEKHIFVPAAKMILIGHRTSYSAWRSSPPMRQGINDIQDSHLIKAYEKQGVKNSSVIAGIITKGLTDNGIPAAWDRTGGATSSDPTVTQSNLTAGAMPIIPNGYKVDFTRTDRHGQQVLEFINTLVGSFAQSLQIPPAFFLDEKLTGPNMRGVIGKAQRRFDERQDLFCNLLDWLWVRVISSLLSPQEIGTLKEGWDRIAYLFPPKATIDAGRDVAQEREDVNNLLMSSPFVR